MFKINLSFDRPIANHDIMNDTSLTTSTLQRENLLWFLFFCLTKNCQSRAGTPTCWNRKELTRPAQGCRQYSCERIFWPWSAPLIDLHWEYIRQRYWEHSQWWLTMIFNTITHSQWWQWAPKLTNQRWS